MQVTLVRSLRPFLALLASAALTAPATAHANDPGSLLLFPEIDARPGSATLLTLTNTNGNALGGTVRVHLIYVDAALCNRYDAFALLTPYDTLTAYSAAHAPSLQRGYAYAYAVAASGGAAIDFDHLVGSAQVLDGTAMTEYTINALVFSGQTGHGNPTDLDSDGIRDLNGLEYSMASEYIAIPRFLGQGALPGVQSELVMIGLSGGTAFTTTLDFLIFNDNEQAFSASYSFYCWARAPLLSISGAFHNNFLLNFTDNNPNEIIGLPGLESGWILIDGGTATSTATTISDPAFVALLVEVAALSSAELPFTIGTQSNGDLLPSSIFGD